MSVLHIRLSATRQYEKPYHDSSQHDADADPNDNKNINRKTKIQQRIENEKIKFIRIDLFRISIYARSMAEILIYTIHSRKSTYNMDK